MATFPKRLRDKADYTVWFRAEGLEVIGTLKGHLFIPVDMLT